MRSARSRGKDTRKSTAEPQSVTGPKQRTARATLLREKEFCACLIQSSVDGILAFDREFRYTIWNPAMERISGMSKKQTLGRCAFDVFPFLKEIGVDKLFCRVLEGQTVIAPEQPYRVPETGREGLFEGYYSPFRNPEGEIVGGLAIIRDITERKRAEEALKESEERYRDLVDNNDVLIGTHDVSGQVLSVNRAVAEVAGFSSADQLMGRSVADFLSPDVRPLFGTYLQEVLAKGRARGLMKVRTRSGEERLIEYDNSLRREGLGKPIVRCIGRDVTEQRRAEHALRESEERFRTMANAAPVMIWVSASDAGCTFFNQPWLDFTGRPMEEQIGNGWTVFVHPDDLSRCMETYLKAFKARAKFEMEYRLRRVDGEYRWILDIGVPLFVPSGNFVGYVGSCLDVTEHKQAQDRLQQLSGRLIKLQEEERQRISRELHDTTASSLTALIANLAMVRRSASALDSRAHKALSESLDLARQCVREIRTVSYLLHPPLLDELGLASALRWYTEGFAKRSGVSIELRLPAKLDRLPREAETALFRIVQEGLTNIHLHSGSPTATIRLAREAGELVGREQITLTLQDEGRGIAPGVLDGPADNIQGLGVGIAGMRERVRQLGGRMEISASSKGTTIIATLPLPEVDP
jgi:PAS domain S-box-containing protein